MPLEAYVREQQAALRRFLDAPRERLLVLRAAPEMGGLAAKLVASLEAEESDDLFVAASAEFEDAGSFYVALSESILESVGELAAEAAADGLRVRIPEGLRPAAGGGASPEAEFAHLCERVAREARPFGRAVVFVLKAESVVVPAAFRASVEALAARVDSPRVKLIVLDTTNPPCLTALAPNGSRAVTVTWPGDLDGRGNLLATFLASEVWRVLALRRAAVDEVSWAVKRAGRGLWVPVAPCPAFQPELFYRCIVDEFERAAWPVAPAAARGALAAAAAEYRAGAPDPEPEARVAEFFECALDLLLPGGGVLVVPLAPTGVRFTDIFRGHFERLAHAASSPRIKYVLFEPHPGSGVLPAWAAGPAPCRELEFRLSPAIVQDGIVAKLAGDDLTPRERMRYTGVLGGFAHATGDHARAYKLQYQWYSAAARLGEAGDMASARYNMGNTLLAAGQPEQAAGEFVAAADAALTGAISPLAAMAFNNLGVALHRTGRMDEALQSFTVARDTFRGVGHLPGEAHVLDSMAKLHAEAGAADTAEALWRAAIALYDGVSADYLADGREAARADFEAKIAALPGR